MLKTILTITILIFITLTPILHAGEQLPAQPAQPNTQNQTTQPAQSGTQNQTTQPAQASTQNQTTQPAQSGTQNQTTQPAQSGTQNQTTQPTQSSTENNNNNGEPDTHVRDIFDISRLTAPKQKDMMLFALKFGMGLSRTNSNHDEERTLLRFSWQMGIRIAFFAFYGYFGGILDIEYTTVNLNDKDYFGIDYFNFNILVGGRLFNLIHWGIGFFGSLKIRLRGTDDPAKKIWYGDNVKHTNAGFVICLGITLDQKIKYFIEFEAKIGSRNIIKESTDTSYPIPVEHRTLGFFINFGIGL